MEGPQDLLIVSNSTRDEGAPRLPDGLIVVSSTYAGAQGTLTEPNGNTTTWSLKKVK